MTRLIALRLSMSIMSLLLVSAFVFALIQLSPVDPVVLALGDGAPAEKVAAMRRELGLDQPIVIQFFQWLGGIFLRGDFGVSTFTHRPVVNELIEKLPVTLSLLVGATVIAITVGLTLGFMAGLRPGSAVDRAVTSVVAVALAIPSFWLALLLGSVFAVEFGLLPVAGYTPFRENPWLWANSLILPCFAVSTHAIAVIARHTRGVVIDVMNSPFIEAIRARGTPRSLLIRRYVLKNALVPVLPVIGVQLAIIIAVSTVMEKVFILPGLGSLMVNSVVSSDFPMLKGAIVVVASIIILINLLVDIGLGLLDPRVRPQ
jgi:peptide/nickel transport system permease protein